MTSLPPPGIPPMVILTVLSDVDVILKRLFETEFNCVFNTRFRLEEVLAELLQKSQCWPWRWSSNRHAWRSFQFEGLCWKCWNPIWCRRPVQCRYLRQRPPLPLYFAKPPIQMCMDPYDGSLRIHRAERCWQKLDHSPWHQTTIRNIVTIVALNHRKKKITKL